MIGAKHEALGGHEVEADLVGRVAQGDVDIDLDGERLAAVERPLGLAPLVEHTDGGDQKLILLA